MSASDNRERERRFFVIECVWNAIWKGVGKPTPMRIVQGYTNRDPDRTTRVRLVDDDEAFQTMKGRDEAGDHPEIEVPLPRDKAEAILETFAIGPLIRKGRIKVMVADRLWEVDEFTHELDGIIIAEIELADMSEHIQLPPWVGREITGIPEYQNANLLTDVSYVRRAYDKVQRLYAKTHP